MPTLFHTLDANEVWRAVVGFEGLYEVSSLGRIRSIPRKTVRGERQLTITGGILTPILNKGYPRVTMRKDGKTLYRFCHQMVAEAFIGPCPEGSEIRHRNGDRADNRLNNLEYGTRAENVADAKRHGAFCAEHKRSQAKLTSEQAVAIFCADGTLSEIGTRFGVSASVVRNIKLGLVWKNATGSIALGPAYRPRRNRPPLSEAEVLAIFASTESAAYLAGKYTISQSVVNNIRTGRSYGRVTGAKPGDRDLRKTQAGT